MFTKEAQEKLKAEYRERLADVWQGKMLDYCTKEADVVVKFRDDYGECDTYPYDREGNYRYEEREDD